MCLTNADAECFEITREACCRTFDRIREKYGEKELDSELLTVIGQMTGSKSWSTWAEYGGE